MAKKTLKFQKIRYKSVISQKSVVKISQKIFKYPPDEGMLRSCFTYYWSCSSDVFSTKSGFYRYFNYLPLYWGPDRPDSMRYYPFSCCGSIATLLEPQFLFLPTVTCVQSDHVPKSPAEMQKSQLWSLITFFWLSGVTPYFTTYRSLGLDIP
jgi:hypothetical protein